MKSREQLIQIALCNQRHLALETPVVEIEELPDDLLTALVDCGNSEHYKLHGFIRCPRKITRYTHAGQRVDVCLMHLLGGDAYVAIRHETGKPVSWSEGDSCKRVPRANLSNFEESQDWWYASVEGNGIVLERELKERNFPALCGSPNFVAVRSAHTETERIDAPLLPADKPKGSGPRA